MKQITYLWLALLILCSGCSSPSEQVSSPDGTICLQVGNEGGHIFYTLTKNNKAVLDKSYLGFVLSDSNLSEGLEISGIRHSS
ncbi:MAG: glycoside hydrolase family 97 N-terminal domain-containing protein, partial [Bacteroides sp.]|nr:glycoside hydrolase family 97 N-terminal domain-containing protein [Bacteroides sp.]